MVDFLKDGLNWLNDQRECHMTCPATYECPGEFTISPIRVTPYGATASTNGQESVDHRSNIQSFVISWKWLVYPVGHPNVGQRIKPSRGDQIIIDYPRKVDSGIFVRRTFVLTTDDGRPEDEPNNAINNYEITVRTTLDSEEEITP